MTDSTLWSRRPLSRGAAFTIHLALSLLIFSSLVAVMMLFWFPGDLFFIDGGWEGLKLVAMVDLVLGPALTLILYKPGKPKLVMDMSMIACIQIAALGYGFYTTHQQRTIAVVFAERSFTTVSASDRLEADQQLLDLSVQPKLVPQASLLKIPVLLTPLPEEGGYGKILEDALNGFPSPAMRNDQYQPIAGHLDELRQHALNTADLKAQGALEDVQSTLDKRSVTSEDVEFYPFTARYADGIAIFDPRELRIVDYVAIEKPALDVASETLDIADGESE